MLSSPRFLLVLSILAPLFGLLSVAGPFALLFHAAGETPRGDLLDETPVFDPPDFEPALRAGAAILGLSTLAIIGIIAVFVVHAARNPALRGSRLGLWVLLLVLLWPIGPLVYWLAFVQEPKGMN